jgi:hypothetical protein
LPNWAEQLSAFSSVVAAIIALLSAMLVIKSLQQTTKALRAQRASSDIQTMLAIWERLDQHWTRFRKAKRADEQFEFGQLTSYYEIACGLFRRRELSTTASESLGEHLRDILPLMQGHPPFSQLFDQLTSKDHTYANIRWFVENGEKLIDGNARSSISESAKLSSFLRKVFCSDFTNQKPSKPPAPD